MWIALIGGVATVFSVIWGARLVRLTGIGICLLLFGAAAIIFSQERDFDIDLLRGAGESRNESEQYCTCGATGWSRFSPTNGSFSILMPGYPSESEDIANTAAGPITVSFFTSQSAKNVAFTVCHNQFSVNTETITSAQRLDNARDQLVQEFGRLLSETTVVLQSQSGREWQFEKNDGKTSVTMRAYLTDIGMFQTICVMPKANVCQKHLQVFLDSFRFN